MSDDLPADVISAYDQAHQETRLVLDQMIEQHRKHRESEHDRIRSVVSLAHVLHTGRGNKRALSQLLAVAVDRLAGLA